MNWKSIRINELVQSKNAYIQTGPFGTQLHASDYVEIGTPVINVRNIGFGNIIVEKLEYINQKDTNRLSVHKLLPNDLVFGRKGAVERHVLINQGQKGWIQGSDCLRLRINSKKISSKFLSYCFQTQAHKDWMINQGSFGATMTSLNQDIIKRINIPLPPLTIQRKIAAVLSAYDDLIENNNRRIAILEKMAEDIYKEWFVRMRFPGHQNVTFHKGIPEGWGIKKLNEFCMLKRGYDLPDCKVKDGVYPVIASTTLKTYHNEFKVQPPVITTGRSGSLGTVLFTNTKAWPLNTTLYVKDFFNNSPYLVFYTLRNLKLENFNAGAGVPTLNRNHLNCIYVPVPPKEIQKIFDNNIAVIFKYKDVLEKTNTSIKKSRDLLLPRLISGKLSVENTDIKFPPSMEN